jgi:hypothetical protein
MKVTARDGGKLVASARIEVGPASERLA